MKTRPEQLVFVVRMWVQRDIPGASVWRGAILEVASGKRLYVAGARDIADFIEALLAQNDSPDG
jgi:hypothetical protein